MKDIKPLVSVIVPVYNVGEYLKECVDSILDQSYKNLEVILVDDGATDISPSICDAYEAKDKRVKVVHKNNGGVAVARNTGLDLTNGYYVMFVDADDIIQKCTISEAVRYSTLNNLALVSFGYEHFSTRPTDASYTDSRPYIIKADDPSACLLYQKRIANAVFGKLFKNSIIGSTRFIAGAKIAEDVDFNYWVLKNTNQVGIITNNYYKYRIREGSAIRTSNLDQRIDAIHIIQNILTDTVGDKVLVKAAKNRLFMEIIFAIQTLDNEDRKQVLRTHQGLIKKLRFKILFDYKSRTMPRIFAFTSVFGISVLVKMINAKRIIKNYNQKDNL